MRPIRYSDLLWDFVYEGAKREGGVKLRVFGSEQEMYESNGEYSEGVPVILPIDWSSSTRSRPEWTRSPIPRFEWMELGQKLWDSLPYDARGPLLSGTPDRPYRLKISSNSPAIDDLPWEWLNDDGTTPFTLHPEIRLTRSVPIRIESPRMTVEPPVRVLLVLTNPKDERLLDPWQEIHAVSSRLEMDDYALRIVEEPTWEALTRTLREFEPHVMHYIGHAGISQGYGNLILHGWENRSHWISGSELSQALPLTVGLLCLSTCFTAPNYQILGLPRLTQTSAKYRLPTMIANRYPVEGESVSVFWDRFYATLSQNQGNVNDAFHDAQTQLAELDLEFGVDWGSFSLVIRDQTGQAMWIDAARSKSLETRKADEIKAQLTSRLASEMAEQLRSFGPDAPDILHKQFREEADEAANLAENLYEGREQ